MSCNGCRILRKGCNDNCILRQSLRGIEGPQAQANATVFVAKFFGRAGLMSFLSGVPEPQRPALFQSLLFEACGRTVNPVNGAVGLLWSGKWHVCQTAVETVLHGGVLHPSPEFSMEVDDMTEETNNNKDMMQFLNIKKRKDFDDDVGAELDLGLPVGGGGRMKRNRAATPSEESETTTLESGFLSHHHHNMQNGGHQERKVLRLFL
ncbi:hypothetical protein LIER_12587 [Lithospermum erythrorhizon]|uniref:LOB domain-containing protein n=1 Tax=Lithospermum erythrorhizon TaxID=34254 RepID=A0AAV3PSG3_LITER